MAFGSEDYVADIQGVRDFDTNISISYPRSLVPIVARAHNLEAIDTVFIKLHNLEGLKKHLEYGKILGYSGMLVVHPMQNDLVNEVFSPTLQEYRDSKNFLRLYAEAQKINKGVAIIEGNFFGPPFIIRSNNIIKRMQLIEKRKQLFKK